MEIKYQKELEKIKKIINKNPRGTTIKEISQKIGINRNVVAKYLDVLQITGRVEVEEFGRSKVYFLSKSIPISTMFDYANGFIIMVTKDMKTVEINAPFVKYLGLMKKNKVIGKSIKILSFAKSYPKMTDNIAETLKKQKILEDTITYKRTNKSKADHFLIKFIPTAFDSGETGVAIIISKRDF